MFSIYIVKKLLMAAFECISMPGGLDIAAHQIFRHENENSWVVVGSTQLTTVMQVDYGNNAKMWQRFIKTMNQHSGIAHYKEIRFSEAEGVVMDLSHPIWMMSPFTYLGGDGRSFYILDTVKNISGRSKGGSFGYCGGSRSYPETGLYPLDNSTSQAGCATSRGMRPLNRIFVQGPQSEGHSYVANTMAPALNDDNAAAHACKTLSTPHPHTDWPCRFSFSCQHRRRPSGRARACHHQPAFRLCRARTVAKWHGWLFGCCRTIPPASTEQGGSPSGCTN